MYTKCVAKNKYGSLKDLLLFTLISYQSFIDSKPLYVRLDKVEGFIRVYDGAKYLVIFGTEKHDYIYNRITCLISVKGGITDIIFHNYAKIEVDSYDSLLLEKTMTFHNVKIVIKSV